MKRTVHVALAILALTLPTLGQSTQRRAGAPQRATPQRTAPQLPLFEFKGVRAGEDYDPSSVRSCQRPGDDGTVRCDALDSTVAGVRGLLPPWFYFYNNRLSLMLYVFDGENFSTILTALTARYGPPCSTTHPQWQNRAGATFDNTVVKWCFRTGNLELAAMSSRRDNGHLQYTDANQPPRRAPTIDF